MTGRPQSVRIFRAALAADAPSVRALVPEANLSAAAADDGESVSHSAAGAIRTFLAEHAGRVVGLLEWRSLGEEGEILELAVGRDHRRQGHASFLLENFLRLARQSAWQGIFLEVRESNLAAIALYRKFGFAASGRRPDYYRNPVENALLMHLSLRA